MQDFDAIAWKFLGSEFASPNYRSWSIDRRIDAYLHHHRLTHIVENHCAYQDLLDHVMANIGRATSTGLLAAAHTRESIAESDCCTATEGGATVGHRTPRRAAREVHPAPADP